MKILAVSVLLVALMALALATEAPPQAEDIMVTEAPAQEKEEEEAADESSDEETELQDEEGEEAESTDGEQEHDVAKRAVCRCPCRGRWRRFRGTYYHYFGYRRTWAQAQHHCRALGGNLASVHNRYEDNWIRAFARNRPAWIGFSDAQQERYWFWIDGTRFNYRNWCRGQPNNAGRREHCAMIKWGARKCWNDVTCFARLPYVCARRRR